MSFLSIVWLIGAPMLIALSALLTFCVRRWALVARMLDVPGARSSHDVPMPRGGGLAIVITTSAGVGAAAAAGFIDPALACALLIGGLAVAWIGFKDDRDHVPARVRFCVHTLAAGWALFVIGGVPPVQFGGQSIELGWAGDVIGIVAIVWVINLFNFMDGIDGLAASEGVFVAAGGAALLAVGASLSSVSVAALVVAAASCGFLVWNWPPARIFMGDVGSGYLGYAIAVLALAATRETPAGIFIWLILGGTFFADATVTLLRRMWRRERVYEAHRYHAYQFLARRWNSHQRVTLMVLVLNVALLLPAAWLALLYPHWALSVALAVLSVLSICAACVGAGSRE